jgi:hypothetical protein
MTARLSLIALVSALLTGFRMVTPTQASAPIREHEQEEHDMSFGQSLAAKSQFESELRWNGIPDMECAWGRILETPRNSRRSTHVSVVLDHGCDTRKAE